MVLGSIYALLALSWVVIYQGTRVLNFGIGQLMFLGALFMSTTSGLPYVAALVISLGAVGVIAGVTYMVAVRPLTGREPFSAAVLAIGVSIMMTAVADMAWGPNLRNLRRPIHPHPIRLWGAGTNTYQLATVALTILVVGGLLIFFRYTALGLKMRAAQENPLLASQRQINVFGVFGLAWALSGVLAALAGISYATTSVVSPDLTNLGLVGIAPALIGGFQSIGGAAIGAFLIAFIDVLGTKYIGGGSDDAVVFAAVLLLIAFRPHGLIVRREARRV